MRRATVFPTLLLTLWVMPLAAQPATDTAIDRLQELGESLRSAPAWRAAFHQEYVPAGMTMGEEEQGVVTVAWPDRALFVTGDPPVRVMGLDGRLVRLVDLETVTCDEHVLDDEEWARVPLVAVLDPAAAVEHFTILERGQRGVALVPRQPGGVSRVEVEVGGDGLPAAVRTIDPQGAVNSLRFAGWKALGEGECGPWLPDVPAGVDCVSDDIE